MPYKLPLYIIKLYIKTSKKNTVFGNLFEKSHIYIIFMTEGITCTVSSISQVSISCGIKIATTLGLSEFIIPSKALKMINALKF